MNTKMYKSAVKEALRIEPDLTGDDLDEAVDEILCRWEDEMAEDKEMLEDTPCLQPEQFMSYHG